ncbi:MAG: hypothetical protein OXE05_04075 [Chloroflexi bacterium]|nr:hypothetical protein [Chloroflexota bacterium]
MSEMAKRTLAKSHTEALFFLHDQILPEDILSAILSLPHCHAAQLLRRLGLDLHLVTREVVTVTHFGPTRKNIRNPSLSATSLRVIELAAEESRSLAVAYIGAAHALLGVLQEEHPASQVLTERKGVRIGDVRHPAGEWAGT